ncbi:MAG TPA: AMP-binding protein, partial [Spirochaetota bacterium]|nr:AMP-binding protein [Spirochaetota bacterium]
VCEGYGATETWNEVTVNRLNKILPGSIGKCSTTALELKVADDGELLVKGDCLFSGYWNNPKATKEAFTEDGFYRTGDIVEVLADNYLKIVDRKKGLMVLDTGKNVPSQRIESLFSLSQFIELVVPIGSERKFVSAIIVPNFDACIAYFDAKGIPYDKSAVVYDNNLGPAPVCVKVGKDFVENEEFKKLIDKEVQTVNKELESYEQIKKYFVVDYKFTEATGEMTPTLKVKRRVVMEKFKEEIDALYK